MTNARQEHLSKHTVYEVVTCVDRFRLEKLIRDSLSKQDHDRIRKIVDQLCHEYAYAVHQPHARNGGLIGLAAASIALGSVSSMPDHDFYLSDGV